MKTSPAATGSRAPRQLFRASMSPCNWSVSNCGPAATLCLVERSVWTGLRLAHRGGGPSKRQPAPTLGAALSSALCGAPDGCDQLVGVAPLGDDGHGATVQRRGRKRIDVVAAVNHDTRRAVGGTQ